MTGKNITHLRALYDYEFIEDTGRNRHNVQIPDFSHSINRKLSNYPTKNRHKSPKRGKGKKNKNNTKKKHQNEPKKNKISDYLTLHANTGVQTGDSLVVNDLEYMKTLFDFSNPDYYFHRIFIRTSKVILRKFYNKWMNKFYTTNAFKMQRNKERFVPNKKIKQPDYEPYEKLSPEPVLRLIYGPESHGIRPVTFSYCYPE